MANRNNRTEEPEYANPGPSPRRGGPPPAASGRSTPDLLDTVKNLFNEDPDKGDRKAKNARKTRDDLQESYDYFKMQYNKADSDEGRNKVLNAAHRHYDKSKQTHKKHKDVVEAAYLDFLEAIRSSDLTDGNDDRMVENMEDEYTFFLDQYGKAENEEDREAVTTAAHRYFALQYAGCKDDTIRAKSSVAYQSFLDKRQSVGKWNDSVGLSNSVDTMFGFHLKNFRRAKNEEERVQAMSEAHQYFMSLSNACTTEQDVAKLGAAYKSYLGKQTSEIQEVQRTQAYYAASSSKSASSSSRSSRSSRKTSRSTTRHSSRSRSPAAAIAIVHKTVEPPEKKEEPEEPEKRPLRMRNPNYYIRWMYFALFWQILFIFAIILIFMFGAFAGCWLRFTRIGLIILVLCWVLFILVVLFLGLFGPKWQEFPYCVIWFIVVTIILAITLALTATYFNCIFFLIVLLGLMTVFLLQFMVSFIPVGYSAARTVFTALLATVVVVLAVIIFLFAINQPISAPWVISLIVIALISLWVAIQAGTMVDNTLHAAEHHEWIYGAVCCYTDVFIISIHLCYMPFSPAAKQ